MGIDEDALYQQVGMQIRVRRRSMGLTQAQLAERSGVLRASIATIERGKQRSPLHIIYKLCQALDVDVVEILPTNIEVSVNNPTPLTITEQTLSSYPKAAGHVEDFRKILGEGKVNDR